MVHTAHVAKRLKCIIYPEACVYFAVCSSKCKTNLHRFIWDTSVTAIARVMLLGHRSFTHGCKLAIMCIAMVCHH